MVAVAPRSLMEYLVEQHPDRSDGLVRAASNVLSDRYRNSADFVQLEQAIAALIAACPGASSDARRLHENVLALVDNAITTATLFGAALSKTWPDSPDGLDRWVDRALERIDRG